MNKTLSICLVAFGVLCLADAQASTLCSGNSAVTIIDLAQGTRTAALTESIHYSAAWETSTAGAQAVIAVNDDELHSATGSGSVEWRPVRNGTYTFTHRVLANGAQVGETLMAIFEVVHCPPDAPTISPVGGVVSAWPVSVTITSADEGATIHYTTDGTEPTEESAVYRRFRISGHTIVKAIAVKNGLCSEVAVAEYAEGMCETPVITAQSSFTGSKTPVALSCATDGATIRYTLDGTEPCTTSDAYTQTFFVTDSCTIKARAFYPNFFDSSVATQTITKVWGIGDTVGAPDHTFVTDGDLPFVRVTDNTAPLGESMKSGAITHSQTSTLSTTVMGPGTISFQWKASCEDSGGEYDWDHAEFWVDGTRITQLDGETTWQTVTQAISGNGSHTLLWKYVKDEVESEGEDCCWVADYLWSSALTETQTTPAHVPYVWLRTYYPETPDEYDFYEAAAKETAANGVNKVWECHVAGLVPTNAADVFRAVISMENGAPVVGWEPRLSAAEEAKRVYTIYGRQALGTGGWTTPTNSLHRFFKVGVEMK